MTLSSIEQATHWCTLSIVLKCSKPSRHYFVKTVQTLSVHQTFVSWSFSIWTWISSKAFDRNDLDKFPQLLHWKQLFLIDDVISKSIMKINEMPKFTNTVTDNVRRYLQKISCGIIFHHAVAYCVKKNCIFLFIFKWLSYVDWYLCDPCISDILSVVLHKKLRPVSVRLISTAIAEKPVEKLFKIFEETFEITRRCVTILKCEVILFRHVQRYEHQTSYPGSALLIFEMSLSYKFE